MKPAKSIPPEYAALVNLLGVDPERLELRIAEKIAETEREHRKWLSYSEAAAYVNASERTFRDRRRTLKIPVTRRFGQPCVYRGDLDALLLAGLIKPTGEASIKFPSIALQAEQAA